MSLLTTIIVLAIFYGSGAVLCHTAETGACKGEQALNIGVNINTIDGEKGQ
jgi:hypothetical protein